jgi:hypothetical protein
LIVDSIALRISARKEYWLKLGERQLMNLWTAGLATPRINTMLQISLHVAFQSFTSTMILSFSTGVELAWVQREQKAATKGARFGALFTHIYRFPA